MAKFGTQDYNPNGGEGDYITKPGLYHFLIGEVDDSFTNAEKPRYEIEFQAKAGTESDQVGKFIHKDKGGQFHISGKAIGRLYNLAMAAGLLSKEYLDAQAAKGEDVEFEPKELEGLQFVAPVVFKPGLTNKEKKFVNLGGDSGFSFFAVGDEEADGCPKDRDTLSYVMTESGELPTRVGGLRKPGAKAAGDSGGAAIAAGGKGGNRPPTPKPQSRPQAKPQTIPADDDTPF